MPVEVPYPSAPPPAIELMCQPGITSTMSTEPEPAAARINVRNKGQRGEREVVKLLQAVVDNVTRRHGIPNIVLQRNALQAHLGGEDIHGLEGFSVEVKFQECDYNPAWWRQCVAQAERSQAVPILFYRKSKQKFSVKFRAYVNTPMDRDQIHMDVECCLEEFVEWFGNAYDEAISAKRGEAIGAPL